MVEASNPQSRSNSSSVSPVKKQRSDQPEQDAPKSLLTRMGGPSSDKAGVGKSGRSRDEINRIIYQCSKNGKFGQNEKLKDQQTTAKIEESKSRLEKMLEVVPRDSKEWEKRRLEIDNKIEFLEGTRILNRLILHVDMDMFYAAVELKRNPKLKGKAFGVGKGLLVTASYEARNYGVSSGMAAFVAKALCPHIILVQNDMNSYVDASDEVMKIFRSWDPNLAQASLDEAYMDVTEVCEERGIDVETCVERIREEVKTTTGLTVSVGIAPNTMLAKICSDFNKPDGQYRVMPDRKTIVEFMSNLSTRKVPGIGRVTQRILEEVLNIKTCRDIFTYRVELSLLYSNSLTGFLGEYLGLGSTKVEPGKREERKSVGREHTFGPCSNYEKLKLYLEESAERVAKDLEYLQFDGRTLTVVFKSSDYKRFTRARTLQTEIKKSEDIKKYSLSIFNNELLKYPPGSKPLELRLIGVRITGLRDLSKRNEMGNNVRSSPGPLMKAWGGFNTTAASSSSTSNPFKKRSRDEDDNKASGSKSSRSSPSLSRSGSDSSFPINLCDEESSGDEIEGKGKGKGRATSSSTSPQKQQKKSKSFNDASDLTFEEEEQMRMAIQRSLEDMRELAELDGEGLTQDFGMGEMGLNEDDEEDVDFEMIDSFDDREDLSQSRKASRSKSPIKPTSPKSNLDSKANENNSNNNSSSSSNHICPVCNQPIKLSQSTLDNPEKTSSEINRHIDFHFNSENGAAIGTAKVQDTGKGKNKKALGPMDRFVNKTNGKV